MADEFDKIVSGTDFDQEVGEPDFWSELATLCHKHFDGIMVKGIVIGEFADCKGRVLRYAMGGDMMPWDLTGILHTAVADVNNGTLIAMGDDEDFE